MNEYEIRHNQILRDLGAGCAVLLRSKGDFPLAEPCELALYGSGARSTIKGGTGSGEVNSRSFATIEQSLEAAGFSISSKYWLESYDAIRRAARQRFIEQLRRRAKENHSNVIMESMGAVMPEPDYLIPLYGGGDTAVYVLSRISGEGSDRQAIPGDILLTETEKRDILLLKKKYERFMLVLNVGGPVDLSPLGEVENILLLSQLGVETGDILADLLLGKSAPSGRLTTTWAAWEDYPQIGDFGERDDTRYREGIYVGYRYFSSVGKKPLFPFGFGLSYTSFSWKVTACSLQGEEVTVTAAVRNTGARAGREVLQLYVSAPQGRLDKSVLSLAAFAKTGELLPGEMEELCLRFRMREIASYDTQNAAWLLEKGDYVLQLGTSSEQVKPVALVRLDGDAVTKQVRRSVKKPDFTDWRPEKRGRKGMRFVKVLRLTAETIQTEAIRYERSWPIEPEIAALSDEELALLNVGAFDPKAGALSVIGNAAISIAGAAGETAHVGGFPSLVMADGPAGLRLSRQYTVDEKGVHSVGAALPESIMVFLPSFVGSGMKLLSGRPKGELHEQYCTAIPIGTALAQSWDLAFAETCGDIVGEEMERFGVHLWLAPALNLHRDIRCGRNFEYFSEDPYISGKFAAAITRGVQKHPGCGTTIKHFCANNQETNRYNSNSQLSERALRELYLRGFGICVEEAQPKALMTSYNLLNGKHTSERRKLLEDVLRCEFGFEGIVMTDWIIGIFSSRKEKYPAPRADWIAAAGNDLTMPGGKGDVKAILKALSKGKLSRGQLEINASRVLRMARDLNAK